VFTLQSENQELTANADQKIALQSQQLEFSNQQINTLSQSLADLKKELVEEKNEHNISIAALEELKKTRDVSPVKILSSRILNRVDEIQETSQEQDESEHEKKGSRRRNGGQTSRLNFSEIKFDTIELENQDLKKTVDLLTKRIENNVEDFYRQKGDLETVVREIERHYKDKQHQDESKIQLLESKFLKRKKVMTT